HVDGGNELYDPPVPANEEVGGDSQVGDFAEIRMCLGIETILKKIDDGRRAIFACRQTDIENDDRLERLNVKQWPKIWRRRLFCNVEPAIDQTPVRLSVWFHSSSYR